MSASESNQSFDLSATAIDPDDPAYQPLLADLQGDILKPNGAISRPMSYFSSPVRSRRSAPCWPRSRIGTSPRPPSRSATPSAIGPRRLTRACSARWA